MNPSKLAVSPSRSLLLVSLGPVQSFIVTARKSSDLWFGSWLLAELAREAARAAIQHDAELLVPDEAALDDVPGRVRPGVPARLVLRTKTGVDPQRVMAAAKKAMLDRLLALFDAVLQHQAIDKSAVDADAARAQLDDLPELTWVSVACEADADLPTAMTLADRLLTARKHHRPFNAPKWDIQRGKGALKSSVDGARESVLDKARMHDLRDKPKELWETLRVRPGEHLCGPGLLKRWAPRAFEDTPEQLGDGARTMSTSHIASWGLRRAWREAKPGDPLLLALREDWAQYVAALNKAADEGEDAAERPGRSNKKRDKRRFRTGVKGADPVLDDYDGGLLYQSRLRDVLHIEDTGDVGPAERALKQLISSWNKTLAQHNQPELSPVGSYYAVVAADGDHLGNTLQRLSLADVKRVSTSLLSFAHEARATVEEHHGQVVYIGGDDMLILAPVETVMRCCDALRRKFKKLVGEPAASTLSPAVREELYGDPTRHPTLSVGVCVAHHLDPFQESVAAARDGEKRAKRERDSFAITVRPRSGPPIGVVGRWDRYETLQDLQDLFSLDKLPGGLPYDLRDAADAVPPGDDPTLVTLRVLEAKRVIVQKGLTAKKQNPAAPEAAPGDGLITLLTRDEDRFSPRELADWMRVARLLSKNEEDRA
jgi:CRISPR-associated protein Cmr2